MEIQVEYKGAMLSSFVVVDAVTCLDSFPVTPASASHPAVFIRPLHLITHDGFHHC